MSDTENTSYAGVFHPIYYMSGSRESNPGHTLPKRVHYHYATPRFRAPHHSITTQKMRVLY